MEIKKTPEADLERYRGTWLLMGFVVALSVLFVAFEWSGQEDATDADAALPEWVFEEELDVPVIERPLPAPPPPAAPPVRQEKVVTVDDETELEEEEPEASGGEEAGMSSALPPLAEPMSAGRNDSAAVYVEVDELPEFPIDGQAGLMRYLTQHIRYPQAAWSRGIQGMVLCQFVVEADGRISGVQVLQGVHRWLDEEAVRVLKGMPRWRPGKLKGQPVRVRYTLPVAFRLQ